jgi:hypothetical protein
VTAEREIKTPAVMPGFLSHLALAPQASTGRKLDEISPKFNPSFRRPPELGDETGRHSQNGLRTTRLLPRHGREAVRKVGWGHEEEATTRRERKRHHVFNPKNSDDLEHRIIGRAVDSRAI